MKIDSKIGLMILGTLAFILTVLTVNTAEAAQWEADVSHSTVGFSVKHLLISRTRGEFKTYTGTFELDPKNYSTGKASFEIDVASIDTRDKKRDDHLRTSDFFGADKHPKITFVSKKIKAKKGGKYVIIGDLTIKGITKSVRLDTELSKPVATPWGTKAIGAHLEGKIDRQVFGVSWNKALDHGGLAVGNEVTLEIDLELIEKAAKK